MECGGGSRRFWKQGCPAIPSSLFQRTYRLWRGEQGLEEGSQQSLISLSKDIILFALHVLKIKGRPSHAFVDIFDVIAGGLKVCGGIIRAGTKYL